MKSIVRKSVSCGFVLMLGACAGVPNVGDLARSVGVQGLSPGGSASTTPFEKVVSVVKDSKDAFTPMTEAQEVELGENVMAGVLGAAPLYDSDRIQRYVNEVGRWVASHSERPNLPWRFAVLKSPLPNAGAAPGGQIYITTGLLFRMRSEAELAGALAHEIAHVVQRHHVKAFQKQKLTGAGATGVAALVDSRKSGALGGVAGKAVAKYAIGEIRTMILLSLDRSEEEQADRMGMVLAARAGYDPFGLPTVLQLLQDMQKAEAATSLLYETHPSPADRIASLDALMGREMEKYSGQATLQDRFVSTMLGEPPPADKKPPATSGKPAAKPAPKTPPKKP